MATVSDYAIATDEGATLQPGVEPTSRAFPFTVPDNANLGQQAVATCMIVADGSPRGLTWNLKVNGTELRSFTHNQDQVSVIQEVFQGSVLRVGPNNNATVTVTGGSGRLEISDIVIHFQVEVASQAA